METVNNDKALVTYKLTDVNHEKLTGMLHATDSITNKTIKFLVSLTKGISTWILYEKQGRLRKNGDLYMPLQDVEFTSTLTSPVFEENPFKLEKWVDAKGNLINYHLTFITTKMISTEVSDMFDNKFTVKSYRQWKAEQFMRFSVKVNRQFQLIK